MTWIIHHWRELVQISCVYRKILAFFAASQEWQHFEFNFQGTATIILTPQHLLSHEYTRVCKCLLF